ncbi:MAG: glycosyltransferase family 39 protein [Planctomycetes bacterium]|nr:glycosyltransferase family 39 protein [Planctomycetota bacterium]
MDSCAPADRADAAAPVPPPPPPAPPPPRRPSRFAALAFLVLALALIPQLWRLGERGIWLADEATYLCEARWLLGAARSLPLAARYAWVRATRGETDPAAARDLADLRARMERNVESGIYPNFCKNTHSALLAVGLALAGDSERAGSSIGVLFGALTVLLVLLAGRALWGEAAGLLAGLALALCPLHILLSRSNLAEADCTFFFAAASALTWMALTGRGRPLTLLFLAGLATGLAFTANNRVAVAAPAIWTLYAIGLAGRPAALPGLDLRLRGLLWLSVGMLLPLIAWELPYTLACRFLWTPDAQGFHPGFFARQIWYATGQATSGAGFGDPACLVVFLRDYVGWPILLLAAIGLARRRRGTDRLDIWAALVPIAWVYAFFLTRREEQSLRYLMPALPHLAFLAGGALAARAPDATGGAGGAGTWAGVAAPTRRAFGVVAAFLALLTGAAFGPREWLEERSGFAPAFAWLREQRRLGRGMFYFTEDAQLSWYYDPPRTWLARAPETIEGFRVAYERGWRHWLVGPGTMSHYRMPPYVQNLLAEVAAASGAYEFDHPAGRLRYFSYEHNLFITRAFAETDALADRLAVVGGRLRIYDLLPYMETRRGRAILAAGRGVDAARSCFQAALAADVGYAPARFGLVRCRLAAREDPLVALAELRALPPEAGDPHEIRQELVLALLRTGRRMEATAELNELKRAGVPPRADVVEELLQQNR